MSAWLLCSACTTFSQAVPKPPDTETKDSFFTMSPVEVRAVRAGANAPFTRTDISKPAITKSNLGQDIPFLLDQTPSVVVNADAGNGVGYTGIRIRGTDATRINVTLNGIPYNDAESQGTFFVDLPDFSSSAGSIQVQRGVGTSSNGAGAFGASLNFSTNEVIRDAYVESNNSVGSFNTWKNNIRAGTGLVKGFTADLRLSRISSDGYIDRASSGLRSIYFSTAYIREKSSIRFNIFSGHEKTYQAWYGVSQADLDAGNRRVNYAGTEKPGEPYDNETDNYTQTHYQLFYNRDLGKRFTFSTALFLSSGRGYYEQYKAGEDFAKYGLPYPVHGSDTSFTTDFIRRLWLDNDFYGDIFSLQYRDNRTQATLGGGITRYNGNHFGELVWAGTGLSAPHRWYDLDARKNDFNIYVKEQTRFAASWYYFYDLQYRHIRYTINGFRDNPGLLVKNQYDFFNPKLGLTYKKNNWKAYLSYSVANKEPNRDDFEAGAGQQPKAERLHDIEAGLEQSKKKYNWAATLFYMRYKDQLVLTGRINDVGAYTRTNIPVSYRAGIELQGGISFSEKLNAAANLAWSRNRVKDFSEYIDDYDNGGQKMNKYSSADIAYSPAWVGGAQLNYLPFKNFECSAISKFVDKQYLDNTQNQNRVLHSFFVQDLRAAYTMKGKTIKECNLIARVNNIFGKKYEPNGYTYSYIYGGATTTENYYFPMAGVNFLLGINFRL